MGRLGVIPSYVQRIFCILIGCVLSGMVQINVQTDCGRLDKPTIKRSKTEMNYALSLFFVEHNAVI